MEPARSQDAAHSTCDKGATQPLPLAVDPPWSDMTDAVIVAKAALEQAAMQGAVSWRGDGVAADATRKALTSDMNFLQMGRISLESVAENIMTCLSCGVILKMSCTSLRMSARQEATTIRDDLTDKMSA